MIWEISKSTSLFFNISPEKIKGENIAQFVEPNLQDDWKTKFEKWHSEPAKTIQIQTCLKANENLFVQVLLNMQKVSWENSSLITVSIVDKTDELKFRKQLRLNEFCTDNAAISIFHIDEPDGKIVNANQLVCSSLGYTKEELCSLMVFDIDSVFIRERWLNHRKRTAHLGSNMIKSTRKRKDGSTFPVEITITYLEYLGNKFSFSFARDISEHMDDEQKLKQQWKDYQYLFLNNPQPTWIYDLETLNFLEVNRAA
jgi:PAS domain S-box-containing protein